MSLSFSGPGGTVEHRWILYALLCDNLRHHLEAGTLPGDSAFGEVLSASHALGGSMELNARRFSRELLRVVPILQKPIGDLAISHRTRAVLDRAWPPPREQDATLLVGDLRTIPWLTPTTRTLDDVFGNVIRSLLAVTERAADDDVLEVRDT